MALYREQVGQSSTYTRSNQITISNPLNGLPSISFSEENIITLPDASVLHQSVFNMGMGGLAINYDPSAVIDLINPDTDAPLGTSATHQELMVILYSLYRQLTTIRDNPPVI